VGRVTTAIAQFMRHQEQTWDDYLAALRRGDVPAALTCLAGRPSIWHFPALTGADGRRDVERFLAVDVVPYLPADLVFSRFSRTVDRFRLVDEATASFTHDCELPWLLPGIAPTHRRAEVLAITVAGFDHGRIAAQRTLWDHATLTAQLGLSPWGSSSTGRPPTCKTPP
jgi:carboxymethylenebutenolidase